MLALKFSLIDKVSFLSLNHCAADTELLQTLLTNTVDELLVEILVLQRTSGTLASLA